MKNVFIRNSHYQFRINIPEYAKQYFDGKALYIKSMKTKNKAIAIKFSKILLKKFEYIKESIKMGLSIEEIETLVNEFTSLRLEDTEGGLYNTANIESSIFYLLLEDQIEGYQNAYQDNNFSVVNKDLLAILKNITSIISQPEKDAISKSLIASHINNLKQLKVNIETNKYANPRPTSKPATIKNIVEYKFGDTFDEFIKNTSLKDQWKQDIISTVEMIKNILFLYFDKNMSITALNNKDLIEFTSTLFQIPNRLTLLKQFKNQNLQYILNNSQDLEKLSITTINKYILRINQFLSYCKKMGYLEKEITLDKIKEKKLEKSRDEYSEEEIKKIISNLQNISQENALVIKIAMYSGMRLNEIIQLTKNDIKIEDDIYYFDINIEDDKRVKNQTSIRRVPVHSEILNELLTYSNAKESNLFMLDAKQYSKWYRIKFNRALITTDSKKVFHSFRHGFVNKLIQKGVQGEHIASLVGHSQELSITFNVYGNKINLGLLKEAIEKVQY